MIPKYCDLPSLYEIWSKPNYEAMPRGTDVYFFGMPTSGQTCLLMGLMGSDGMGYSINFHTKGGLYASALIHYLKAGKLPAMDCGNFVSTIRATIEEKGKKGEILNHEINFVELPGEKFSCKIANNEDTVEMEDMGSGTVKLLRNKNRKVFFIIVDPTRDIFKFTYEQPVLDSNGNMISVNPRHLFIDQTAGLAKFISLFEMPENKEFMKNVDAIHFIVTKADTLGRTDQERKERAHDLLLAKYQGPIRNLITFCRRSKRINYATDFKPMVYPFSLGRFSDDRTFEYDNRSSLAIIDALRHMTAAKKEGSFWGELRDCLIKPL